MPFSLFQRAVRILCIALSIETCLSSPVANTTVLRPVHTAEYYRSFGIQPRDPNQFSKLELQTQGELIYGGSQDNGDLIVANMTLYAPDGLLMVLLEHFDHLTSAIDCEGDDGILSLTFNSHQSYEYALQAWGFVNANADGKFLLIANHKGCGPDDERQAYIINSIREDGVSLTTYLAAQPAPWSDIGGTYDLDFGHVMAYRHGPERRNWIDKLKGNFDITKEKDFDLSIGHPDDVQTLWHDDKQVE